MDACIAKEWQIFTCQIGLNPCFSTRELPYGNNISEAFVRTLKSDWLGITPLPDTQTGHCEVARLQAVVEARQVELDRTTIHASVSGSLQQFTLRPSEVINPLMRPDCILVPEVQGVIASGQVRASDQLCDPRQIAKPGTIMATLAPLYKGERAKVPRGSSCIANA